LFNEFKLLTSAAAFDNVTQFIHTQKGIHDDSPIQRIAKAPVPLSPDRQYQVGTPLRNAFFRGGFYIRTPYEAS